MMPTAPALLSIPVNSGSASGSKKKVPRGEAFRWRSPRSPFPTRTFHSAVRPDPRRRCTCTQRPHRRYGRGTGTSRAAVRPSSRLTELIRPPAQPMPNAVSATGPSVVSTMIGTLDCVANRLTSSSMSATPSAPVNAHVDDVGALFHLVTPRSVSRRLPTSPRGTRPRPSLAPLAHHEERGVLVERHGRIDGCRRRFRFGPRR